MQPSADAAPAPRVLIVEDDSVIRTLLAGVLTGDGYDVESVDTGEQGLRSLEAGHFDLVLLDIDLPGMSGMEVLAAAGPRENSTQFVITTGFGSVATAVEAIKLGAFDYLTKPLRTEELRLTLKRALAEADLKREVNYLRREVGRGAYARIVGKSPPMQRMLDQVARVAPTRATVLITGETGTGKELVAKAIHDLSERSRKPFVPVHCTALSETLLESELFGHVKGSFTDAVSDHRGLFEEAGGGTLFLDEIATINPKVQVKLLRAIQERAVRRVGGTQSIPTDFRLVVATNEELSAAVAAGRFRSDLYYRLQVCPIRVPPLRERRDDIPLLVNHFRQRVAEEINYPLPTIPPQEMQRLMDYDWPGNVRELEHAVERAMIMQTGGAEIHFQLQESNGSGDIGALLHRVAAEEWDMARLEREYILRTLERTHGHKGRAAEILQLDRRTIYRKLKSYGMASATDGA